MWAVFLFWTALAVYIVVVLSTLTVVTLENRQPAKTIAWTVVLVMLPVLGLVIFYFFGQSVRKDRYIGRRQYNLLTQRMLADIQPCPPEACPPKYAPLIRLFEHMNKAVLTADNHIESYSTGADFIMALLREIASAKDHVHLETYIIEDDPVGRLVADALADKAAEGVEVRLIYDDVGCWNVPNSFFRRLEKRGVQVGAFLPVRFPQLTHKVNYRNHRKLCVVDGRTAFIGGMNLAYRYVSSRKRTWHDLHMRVTGGAVAGIQRLILSDWCFVTNDFISGRRYFPAATSASSTQGDLLQIVQSNPVSRYPEIMYGLTWAILHARRYLYIQTPYFMPTEPVMQALQTAAMSGVDVRLMVPEKPDGFWLRWVNDCHFTTILKAGIRVFTHHDGFLHSKCAVADDDWCTVGSSNMDFRSFENNFEANAFIYGETAARAVKAQFLADAQSCTEVKLSAWIHRPVHHRLLESYTRILSPLL